MSAEKNSSLRLMNSPHKISHQSCKIAPIFTTFTHDTSLDSLNKHACYLQRTATNHQTKKCGVYPAAATLPELLISTTCYMASLTLSNNRPYDLTVLISYCEFSVRHTLVYVLLGSWANPKTSVHPLVNSG